MTTFNCDLMEVPFFLVSFVFLLLQYLGSVNTSMRTLQFNVGTQVTK